MCLYFRRPQPSARESAPEEKFAQCLCVRATTTSSVAALPGPPRPSGASKSGVSKSGVGCAYFFPTCQVPVASFCASFPSFVHG